MVYRILIYSKRAMLFSLILLCFQAYSEEPAVMELVKKKYTPQKTIQALFDMKIYWSVREREEHKSGKLYLAPANRFRVELENEVLVSDGNVFWQFSRRNNQVIIKNLRSVDFSQLPSHLLSTYLTEYSYKEKERTSRETVLFWNADSASESFYTAIHVWVSTETGVVNKLQLTDKNENVHTYTFKKTVFGSKIPEKTFTFEVPDGIQVLDDRK